MPKKKNITKDIDEFNKKFGITTAVETQDLERISTGILTIDHILDGGFPKGRIVELSGPPGSGKSTLALSVIKGLQDAALSGEEEVKALYVDLEGGLSNNRLEDMGIDSDWLHKKTHPEHGEQALDLLEKAMNIGVYTLIVLDSVASLTPKSWMDGDIGDTHKIGARASLLSEAMERLHASAYRNNVCVVFINQVRENLDKGGFGGVKFTTTGGKALPHAADLRLNVKRIGHLKDKDDIVGHLALLQIEKNRIGRDRVQAEFEILYEAPGIDCRRKILELAQLYGVISRKGAWYSCDDTQLGQGIENTMDFLDENPEWSTHIVTEVAHRLEEVKRDRQEKARKRLETQWKVRNEQE